MIKNYKLFTEGILDKLKGPTYEEVLKNISPNKLLKICFIRLDDIGVEYALEHGASVELYSELTEMKEWFLDLITDMEVVKSDKYPDSVFYKKNGDILFQKQIKYNTLWIEEKIWKVFMKLYKFNHSDIQLFIKNMVGNYLNWKKLTPMSAEIFNII